jgi:hypothetical protein
MPHADRAGTSPEHAIVPRAWVTVAAVAVLAVAIAGYYTYHHFESAFRIPPELARFTVEDSVRALVANHAPAPPADARLDAATVALYVDGAERTGRALLETRRIIDSTFGADRRAGDSSLGSMLMSPSFYRVVTLLEPRAKRALVAYLNERGRSLDEYAWAKLRVVAASGITRESVDSSMRAMIGRFFTRSGARFSLGSRNTDAYFRRVDSLRASGAITDTERALATAARSRLLSRGLASLYGFDTDFGE